MPLVKMGPKHQITIPKEIFETFQLKVGDIVEMLIQDGKIIIIPKPVGGKSPTTKAFPKGAGAT